MVSVEPLPYPGMGIMRPPSAISRRPSLGSKRESSFMETDDDTALTSSTKRLKVAFDPRIDVRIMDDAWANKSVELVQEEVKVAIDSHLRRSTPMRDGSQYQRLVHLFTQSPFDSDAIGSNLIVKYLTAIEQRASDLPRCEELLTALVNMQWLGRSPAVFVAYVRFLVSALSTGVAHISVFIERVVYDFHSLSSHMGNLPSEDHVPRDCMFDRLHVALNSILDRHPAAVDVLLTTIRACYVNEITSTRAYVQFLKNLLTIRNHIPYVEAEILAIVVQRLVALDVQIQQDIEDLEEDAEDGLLQGREAKVQDLEYLDDSDNETVSSSDETCTEEEERMAELRSKVAKMDATMELLFIYYDQQLCDPDEKPNEEVFQQLMALFLTFILPNRTRHAQFLVFHFAQTTPDRIALFAQQCIESGFGTNNAAQKCSAIAYLSSFMARAAFLDRDAIRETFRVLCQYLDHMRKQYEPQCRGPDRRAYLVYYAVAQAVLYIFCFRWRFLVVGPRKLKANEQRSGVSDGDEHDDEEYEEEELTLERAEEILEEHGELEWIPDIKNSLKTAIFGPLNPLRVCAPAIVTEFANLSRHVRFIEVLSKLETNKRLRLGHTASYYGVAGGIDIGRRETAWDRKKGDAHHQMEPYFPFDPYHLPISKKWLANDYLEWEPPRGVRRDDDDGDDDEEDASDSDSSDEESVADHLDDDDAILESASISS